MGKNDNFVVDTKNLCFLCYRPAKIVAAGVKGRVKDKTFSLRSISRFMDVDFQKMVTEMMPPSSSSGQGVGGKFPQVLVTVCSRCSTVTEEFSTLYQYMEFTQMKINACVRNLRELMSKTDCNARLVDKFHKKMLITGSSGSKEMSVVQNIRRQLVENCSLVLQNSFPRVKVRKFGERVPPRDRKIAKLTGKLTGGVKPSPRSKKPGFSSTILKTDNSSIGKNVLAVNANDLDEDDEDNDVVEKKITGGMFQCLHCDYTFNAVEDNANHIVRYHKEQFFSMFKAEDVADEDFKVAVQLLFRDVRKITTNNGGTTAVSFVCTCCGKPFSAKIDTYMHMIKLHLDVLSTKLQSIQRDKVLLASAKKTIRLPGTATTTVRKRGPRGPYRTKKKGSKGTNAGARISNAGPSNEQSVPLSTAKLKAQPSKTLNQEQSKAHMGIGFSRTCECGVQLSSKAAWYNHQRLHCKLKKGIMPRNNIPATTTQHSDSVLKRAKNNVGFPRTCACGVRLSVRTSWNNHQRLHCKLKFGNPTAGNPVPKTQIQRVGKKQGVNTARKKKKIKGGKLPFTKDVRRKTRNKYACECGSVLSNYSSWYYHTNKACKLKNLGGSDAFDVDMIEEVPIDISPSGELYLPSTSTSIETSPVPKIMSVVSSRGGVLKGLHRISNFQNIIKTEKTNETKDLDTGSFSELFSKFLPPEIPLQEIEISLHKVLHDYRKFPGNISGCPYCGRGFTQVKELHIHMVREDHFDEVLMKLRSIFDPNGMALFGSSDGTINVDPSLVKTENQEDENARNDLNVLLESDNLQTDPLNENQPEDTVPKDEITYPTDETEDPDQLLILP